MCLDLNGFFYNVVKEEKAKSADKRENVIPSGGVCYSSYSHDLASQEQIVHWGEVGDEPRGGERLGRQHASGGGEFEGQLPDEEEVDVDVVHGEVDGDESRPLRYPESLLQLGNDFSGLLLQVVQVLHVP